MLKNLLFTLLVLTFLSVQTVFSQGLINGTVVDVTDGRTLVVANSTGKTINVRLRYLEIPEPEQPLSDVVKSHLKDLALGKKIYVTKVQVFSNYTLGVILINEKTVKFDLTQQMIRDGAGWFDSSDASAATDESVGDYQATETLAKDEKRGIWSIPEMKTPWDYRKEKDASKTPIAATSISSEPEKKADDLSLAELVKNSADSNLGNGLGRLAIYDFEYKTAKPVAETGNSTETKSATDTKPANSAGNNPTNDLTQIYFAHKNHGTISTKVYEFAFQNGKVLQRLGLVFIYDYSMDGSKRKISKLGLAVFAERHGTAFLQGKSVGLTLDQGKKLNLGIAKNADIDGAEGISFENLDRNEILSMLESNSITISIGKFKAKIPDSYKQTINNFVDTLK